ncbi:putative glycosyl transferase [Escherichia coli O104:H4 str. LB226692]|nr:putative glycosyl transferase [Escherichia coli O104:H4 str. LB226692]
MNILFTESSPNIGGQELQAVAQMKALKKWGIQFCLSAGRTAKLLLKPVSLELISHSRYFETVFTFLLYGDYSE